MQPVSTSQVGAKSPRRWIAHTGHATVAQAHVMAPDQPKLKALYSHMCDSRVLLDGSVGEGGGQILRTALTLSLLTGRPFRMVKVRANRTKPGLRPQHLAAVQAAALLGDAEVQGAAVGSRELTFNPGAVRPRDLTIDIGTAGATALVLHTLHLPLAMHAESGVRLTLKGGTFNTAAPSFPFLDETWRRLMARLGFSIGLTMPKAGFYPVGGGRLEAWIEPGQPKRLIATERPPLERIHGVAGVAGLDRSIAERMKARAIERLLEAGFEAEIRLVEWSSASSGVALNLVAEHGDWPASFLGLGERGKPAEAVADEAVDELLAHEAVSAPIDPHSADQILMPLALAKGRSEFTVSSVTEHLRTNASTINAFLDRSITIVEGEGENMPGRVVLAS